MYVSHTLVRWLAVVIWAALIFWLSAQPDLTTGFPGMWETIARKFAHVTEYAVLAWLLSNALVRHGRAVMPIATMAIILTVLYATTDEVHQLFVPGRVGSPVDLLYDSAGAFLGALIRAAYRREIT